MTRILKADEYNKEVLESKGVVVVDFFATWCGPCSMLTPIYEEVEGELGQSAKFFKIDIDQANEIAQRNGVYSVPTIKIFKDGKELETMVGVMPKEKLVSKVKSFL